MTPTSGRFIGSSIAGLIVVARGRDYCTLSSGKASTTPLMQRVGNHPNTSPTHPTLSRNSIKPIQTSRPLKFMRRGPCYIHSLILSHSNDYFRLRTMFLESIHFFLLYTLKPKSIYLIRPLVLHPPRHLPHCALHLRFPDRHLPHRSLLPQHCHGHHPRCFLGCQLSPS